MKRKVRNVARSVCLGFCWVTLPTRPPVHCSSFSFLLPRRVRLPVESPVIAFSVALGDRIGERHITRFQIQFSFGWRAKHARASVIEFAFPSRDHDSRQAISDQIHACPSHVHQFIHTKDDGYSNWTESCRQEAVQRRE